MFDDYLSLYLRENLMFFSVLIFLCLVIMKIARFLMEKELVQDMTKTKWARNIPTDVLRNQGDIMSQKLTGWFPLFRSTEIGVSQVKASHVFGMDLVVFRSGVGKVYVLDAYCPHMGTYLPVGGKVVGNDIRCPFHGWTFDGQGQCSHVPGLESSNLPSAKIKSWNCIEMNGVIMIWYHPNDEPPTWMPMKNKDLEGLEMKCKFEMTCLGHYTEPAFNAADYTHFPIIHSDPGIVDPDSIFQGNWFYTIMSKLFHLNFNAYSETPDEKHQWILIVEFEIFVLGKKIGTGLKLKLISDGPYLSHFKWWGYPFDDVIIIASVHPIPGRKFKFIQQVYSKPGLSAKIATILFFRVESTQLLRDGIMWANKLVLKQPHYTQQEKDLVQMTRFLKQFEDD